jgi:dipeptidase E
VGTRRELMLLSNSRRREGDPLLAHVRGELTAWLPARARIAFVPYALADHEDYTAKFRTALEPLGFVARGVHEDADPRRVLADSDAVFVGGGNSFRLVRALQETGLREAVRDLVGDGMPYIGSSAGTNVACPTIRTTNDMPIVEVPSLAAIGVVPFQINPHYQDPEPHRVHMGETREERLLQFLECNDVPVLGLREGSWLEVRDDDGRVGGDRPARLFRRGHDPVELEPGASLEELLATSGRFDV